MAESIVIQLTEEQALLLHDRSFQIHALPGGKVRLYPLDILKPDWRRCPVIVGGERCGGEAGHEGKHFWAGGD